MRLRMVSAQVAAVVLLAACGSSVQTPTANTLSSPSKVPSLAAEVPQNMLALAPWQLATDANGNAPGEYIDPATGMPVGSDIDLGYELCKVLGVVCTWNNVTFDDLIAQLKASTPSEVANGDAPRYLFSIAGMTPRPAREAAGIDFITYFKAGEVWEELASGPPITTAVDMCGHTVAVQAGIIEEADAWGFMGKEVGGNPIPGDVDNCKAAGKADITVLSFPNAPQADQALNSGRADFEWNDEGPADWAVKQSHGKWKVAGPACSVGRYGIALVKNSPLEKPITDALKYLIDNGYYIKIFQKWGNAGGAISSSDVQLNDNSTVGPSCVPKY
jgi:polar amino acid transport system substrate-binding protein